MLDPAELGWTEFWLRIAVIFFLLLILFFIVLLIGRIALSIFDLVSWMANRNKTEEGKERKGKDVEESYDLVYISQYHGHLSRAHKTPEAAQAACAEILRMEPGPAPHWDWFGDASGWVMCRIEGDGKFPGEPVGGRVTKSRVEE